MQKLKVYLIGAMEAAPKLGAGWRNKLTPFLVELGLEVLNPVEFEPEQLKGLQPNRLPDSFITTTGTKKVPKFWHDLKLAKEPRLYNRFLKYMRRIIHFDINVVQNEADYIICHWDEATGKGAGTHSELTTAFLRNIPVYCVKDGPMPAWAMACCTEIFDNFDDLKEFLKEEFDYDS